MCTEHGEDGPASRKGFQVGPKLLAFIVAILALVILLILVGQEFLLEVVPAAIEELKDTVLGGLP